MEMTAHAAARWAQVVIQILELPQDPCTVAAWGRAIGASEGSLRNVCYGAHLPPRGSLCLARMLRALYLSRNRPWQPYQLLNVVDRRTLHKLLEFGGIGDRTPPTISDFLHRQQWIVDPVAITELQKALCAKEA